MEIACGFEEVLFDHYPFRDEQINKGTDLVEADHIFNVREKIIEGKETEICCHCIPQAKVMDPAYFLFIKLDIERRVKSVACNCGFGGNADCKHAYALLLYINTERDDSKTSENCTWKDPSKAGKKRYPKGQRLEVIANIHPKYHRPPVLFERPSDEDCKKQLEIMEAVGNTETPVYKLLKMKLTPETPEPEPQLPDWVKEEAFKPCVLPDDDQYIPAQPRNEKERIFYKEKIMLNCEQRFSLCRLTIPQGLCQLWHDERGPRFTGSTVNIRISYY